MERLHHPLGFISGGRDRKTSPLRFWIVACEGSHRILALWDDRTAVTHNQSRDLAAVIGLLANGPPSSRPKEIGRLLAATSLARL